MANIYKFPTHTLLKRIGLSPGQKLFVFFISLVAVTLPMGHIYNSISLIFFVLYSVLSARIQDFSFKTSLLLPIGLFGLMAASLLWTLNSKSSLMALSKEASLLFIPLVFCINRKLTRKAADGVLKNYGIAMCLFALYFLGNALSAYTKSGNVNVFFHNNLATPVIRAVYLSALFSLALFVFLSKRHKTLLGYVAMLFLLITVFLLSVKSIIIVDVLLIILYYLIFSGLPKKAMYTAIGIFIALVMALGYYGNIYNSLVQELQPACRTTTSHNVTVGEAWYKQEPFSPGQNLNAAAFRTYQLRIFTEMLHDDPILFTGYGLNASRIKVEQKGQEHNLKHPNQENIRYNRLDFHNQFIEAFADLGLFGFILIIAMAVLNLKNALKNKDFVHIAFAILMISLFLTESFLWRQRGVVFFTVFYCLFNNLLPNFQLIKKISTQQAQQ